MEIVLAAMALLAVGYFGWRRRKGSQRPPASLVA
jgi:hypothetical protein